MIKKLILIISLFSILLSSNERIVFKYDSLNNIIEKLHFPDDRFYPDGELIIYEYDSNNNIIEEYTHKDYTRIENCIGEYIDSTSYVYDSKNHLIQKTYIPIYSNISDCGIQTNIWKTTYEYNSENNLIKHSYFLNGNLRDQWNYNYDSNNNLVKDYCSSCFDLDFGTHNLYRYDKNNNLIEELHYGYDDHFDVNEQITLLWIILYKYDKYNKLIEESFYGVRDDIKIILIDHKKYK